jgi:hypothetical protein
MIITARTWRWREIEIGSADVDLASMVAGCRAVMVDGVMARMASPAKI